MTISNKHTVSKQGLISHSTYNMLFSTSLLSQLNALISTIKFNQEETAEVALIML